LCERDKIDVAKSLLAKGGEKIALPVDAIAATELKEGVSTQSVQNEIPPDLMGLDIGPRTLDTYSKLIFAAGTIVWNGPVGAFETRPFEAGTYAIARLIAHATDGGAVSVIGGGDSASAIEHAGIAERMTHISTGGGASLEFLEGKKFGPIEVLDEA
jgi:phosphoglycerate kinase